MNDRIDNKVYKFFADYILQHTGIVYEENEYYRLEKRLQDLANEFGHKNIMDLYNTIHHHISGRIHDRLIQLATNNETYFFRDDNHFKILNKLIIPELNKLKGLNCSLNIWSAGCSSGQEPYSILINLIENYPGQSSQIYGTDICSTILARAQKAIYSDLDIQRGMPIKILIKYFNQLPDDAWQLKPEFRSKVNFGAINLLLDDFPSSLYDIIFCRNVLIYQNLENKKSIIKKFFRSLRTGGYLIMGSGESLPDANNEFKKVFTEGGLVFKKE